MAGSSSSFRKNVKISGIYHSAMHGEMVHVSTCFFLWVSGLKYTKMLKDADQVLIAACIKCYFKIHVVFIK